MQEGQFFRILMIVIVTNASLFEGEDDSKVSRHSMVSLEDGTFKHISQIMAMSLVHGGLGPQCLSSAVVDYLTNGTIVAVHAGTQYIPHVTVKRRVAMVSDLPVCIVYIVTFLIASIQLESETTEECVQEMLDSEDFAFRYDCGLQQPGSRYTLKNRDSVIRQIATHYAMVHV